MPNPRVQEAGVTRTAIQGPVPQVEVNFTVDFEGNEKEHSWALTHWFPEVQLCGVPLPVASQSGNPVNYFGGGRAQGAFRFRILLYPHLIRIVDAVRTGDLKGSIQPWMHYTELMWLEDRVVGIRESANAPRISFDFSRDEWNKLLGEIGFDGAWTVEIPQPSVSVPGWEKVADHLETA